QGQQPLTWGLGLCPNCLFFLFCAAAGGAQQARKEAGQEAHWLRSPDRDICVYLSDPGKGLPPSALPLAPTFAKPCATRGYRLTSRKVEVMLLLSCQLS